jgi:hypothetical protein
MPQQTCAPPPLGNSRSFRFPLSPWLAEQVAHDLPADGYISGQQPIDHRLTRSLIIHVLMFPQQEVPTTGAGASLLARQSVKNSASDPLMAALDGSPPKNGKANGDRRA